MRGSKRSTNDPVRDAVAKIKAILRELTPEQKRAVEHRMFNTKGYFDDIRETFNRLARENNVREWKARGRKSPLLMGPEARREAEQRKNRDMALAIEKCGEAGAKSGGKSWEQMCRAHPDMKRSTLRNAVARGLKALGRKPHAKI